MRKILVILGFLILAGVTALWLLPRPDLYPPSFSRLFEDRRGLPLRLTLSTDEKYRLFTPLSRMPKELVEGTLLYEDRYFYQHPGINPLALARACMSMLGGGRRMGGSTITMQLARLVWQLDTTSVPGKLLQMGRAVQIERHYTKAEILEAYLNLAPYGANVEGVGAAALVWFHKRAEQLSLPESFALATVPQHPAARNPLAQKNKPWQRLYGLWRAEHPDEPDYGPYFEKMQVFSPTQLPFAAPHAVDNLLADKTLPMGTVRTTLDMGQQGVMERLLGQAVARGRLWGMKNGSALLLHWPSGEIRAMAGSAGYFNQEIQGQVDGTRASRSPGSTLKPFIYALALQNGLIHPQTILADSPRNFGAYQPENSDGQFRGPVNARLALQASRNIPAITLANQLPRPGLYGFLKEVVPLPFTEEHYGLALVLGGAEMTMRDLAGLYGMLAARGNWRPIGLLPGEKPGKPLLLPEAAFVALDMLRAPVPRSMSVPLYWKTGTSNGYRDAWTAGIFGPYVLITWVGNFDATPNPGFTGLGAAAPLFFDMAQAFAAREKLKDEPRLGVEELNLRRLDVCTATGDINTGLCTDVTQTWFIPGVSPIKDSGILRPILLDKETGLRQCVDIPGRTEQVIWEFWPSDLSRLFRQAGLDKPPPPPWAPGCEADNRGAAPLILSPKSGLAYARRFSQELEIPLRAVADAGVDTLFWFAGSSFLGSSSPEETLFWKPGPGVHTVRVLDNAGRASSLQVRVEATP